MNYSLVSKTRVVLFLTALLCVSAVSDAFATPRLSSHRHKMVTSFTDNDVATTNGRADGTKQGRSDKQRHLSFNFANKPAYMRALRGYKPSMGDRAAFQASYRKAYEVGYRDGWNGY